MKNWELSHTADWMQTGTIILQNKLTIFSQIEDAYTYYPGTPPQAKEMK